MSPIQHARRATLTLAAALACSAISSPSWAADHFCDTNQEFIDALDNSAPGDTITLDAATTFTAPSGGFILPQKSGSTYITIRSSNLSSLPPEGERIQPSDAANMPDIRPPVGTSRAMRTVLPQSVSHHWKLVGIEFIGAADNSWQTLPLLEIGSADTVQNTEALIPHHFIIDRCYFHDNTVTQTLHRPVGVHGNYVDIINSNISGAKHNSQETQAIWGLNCKGPINIINNYLEGAGENVMFGGGIIRVPDVQPENIVIQRNYFYKPNSWQYGHAEYDLQNWHVKNHFELKCGRYVTIDSNIFDNCWYDAGSQYGTSLNLKTSRTDLPGNRNSPWVTTEDITITNNIIRNVGLGITMAGSTNPDGSTLNGFPRNITIRNNLVYGVDRDYPNDTGDLFRHGTGSPNITVDHNTMFQSGSGSRIAEMWGPIMDNYIYTNNINVKTSYTWRYGGSNIAEGTFAHFFVNGFVWGKNVIKGDSLSNYDLNPYYKGGWDLSPHNNASLQVPADWSTVLVDFANPGADFAGWKVKGWDQPTNVSLYPYNNTGTDGKDIGCDIDAVVAATAGCISGVWDEVVLSPVDDAYINGGASANTNFGGGALVTKSHTDGDYRRKSYMRFDVSGLNGTVSGAELRLFVFTSNFSESEVIEVYGLNDASSGETTWTESGITWNNAPGNDTADNDFLNATLLGQVSYTAIDTWMTLSSAALDNFINADSNNQITVMLRAPDGTYTAISSIEHANGNGPELVIPGDPSDDDIVLYASEAPTKVGNWVAQSDVDAAGGMKIHDPNGGAAKENDPLANPAHYFEMTFNAQAGVAYRLWMRMEADSNNWANDSVHVQFDKSDNASGTNVYRIGTTDGTWVSLEEYTNQGVQNWGWSDNGHGALDTAGPLIYFETAGQQTIRVQRRDDGVAIDQIVLSPVTYLNARPGPQKNDTTILPEQQ